MAYIFAADSMGLSSFNFCGGLRKTHLFWNRMRIGRSRSSKVVHFSTNRKGVCDFLLVININFGPISHRFWDTASYWLKIANFWYTPLSFGTFLWGDPLRIFRLLSTHTLPETRIMGLSECTFHDPAFALLGTIPACDRRTDGQTRCRKERASIASRG